MFFLLAKSVAFKKRSPQVYGESVILYMVIKLLYVKTIHVSGGLLYPQKNSTHICAVKMRTNIDNG